MTPQHAKPSVHIDERSARVQAANNRFGATRTDVEKAIADLLHAVNGGLMPGNVNRAAVENGTASRFALAWVAKYDEAIAALDRIDQLVRPALTDARQMLADLAAELAAEELAFVEASAAEERRQRLERQVAGAVVAREAARLAEIENEERARRGLATTGGTAR